MIIIFYLTKKQHEVFQLSRVEKLSFSKIAIKLNLNSSTVSKRINICLEKAKNTGLELKSILDLRDMNFSINKIQTLTGVQYKYKLLEK